MLSFAMQIGTPPSFGRQGDVFGPEPSHAGESHAGSQNQKRAAATADVDADADADADADTAREREKHNWNQHNPYRPLATEPHTHQEYDQFSFLAQGEN